MFYFKLLKLNVYIFGLVIVIFCYLSGIWIYCFSDNIFLVILLSFEYIVLFTFLLMCLLGNKQYELFFSMIYGADKSIYKYLN